MENTNPKKQFEKEQYNDQANLVYINTMIFSLLLSGIFFFIVNSIFIGLLNFFAAIFCGVAIFLNKSSKYELGSLIYIGFVSLVTVMEVLVFGLNAGFQYIFFSLVGLIMYTKWRTWQKLAAVVLEIILVATVFFLTYGEIPLIQMSYEMTSFFHVGNIVLNIVGISNSAHYYISITKKAYTKVSSLAMKDYLTNLMNRNSFDYFMNDIFHARNKTPQSLGILMIDIDHFKAVNDTYGHLCGDEILRQLATILTNNIRPDDCAARYGGEEFIIITKMDHPEQLQNFAERLRKEIEAKRFQFDAEDRRITVSLGVLFISHYAEIDQTQAISQVDKLLYQAKAEGRNRVVFDSV